MNDLHVPPYEGGWHTESAASAIKSNLYIWRNAAKARIHYAVRRCLTQKSRNEIKKWQRAARQKMAGVMVALHGRYTTQDLIGQLRSRVPSDAEIIMVHSAYDRLLPMYRGTPADLVEELIAFCGGRRTLVMPSFVLGGRLYDKVEYFRTRAFDARRTPSEMGLLSEIFRRRPGVLRSLHPTHSVCAFGPRAAELTRTHHLATTRTGENTPFATMARIPTAIVGLGIEYFRCLTQTHTAEDLLGEEFPVEFQRRTIPTVVIDAEGNKLNYSLTLVSCSKLLDNTVLRSLLPPSAMIEWNFHGTAMFATSAGAITECLIEAARRGITVFR